MDNAYYEDLAGRLYGLIIRLAGRLPPDEARWLRHVVEAGEYGLALENMAGMPAHGAITGAGREDMLALAGRMKREDGLVPRALAACPQAGEDHGAGSR